MGGFFGRTGRPAIDDAEQRRLDAALGAISHRGPKAPQTRTWRGTYLGYCQGEADSEQPVLVGDWEVLFDGALQNAVALQRRLQHEGELPPRRNDAHIAAAWIAAFGAAGLADMQGMFAIAAVHRKTGDALLARDRFGIVPLYLAQVQGCLLFASEPRALLAASPALMTPDARAQASFLAMGQPLGAATCWENIRRVLPGTYVRWQADPPTLNATVWYRWPPSAEPAPELASTQAERDAGLEALVQEVVQEALAGPEAPGVLVNADVGSALLAYYAVQAARAAGHSPPVLWTMGLPDTPAEVDAAFAVDVARHVGAPHTVVDFDVNTPFDFDLLGRTFDEPCADVSAYLFCVMGRLARQHGASWVTGNGATSAFLGASHQLASLDASSSPWHRAGWLQRLARQGKGLCGPLTPLRRKLDRATLPPVLLPLSFTTLTHASAVQHVLTAEALEHVHAAQEKLMVEAVAWEEGPHGSQHLRLLDIRTLQPMRQLLKLDRAAHAFGLQWRPLWYDARILAYASALPETDLLESGMGAQTLRRLVRKRLPQSVATLQRGPAPLSFKRLLGAAQDRIVLARVYETPAVRAWIDPDKLMQLLKVWRQAPTNHLDGTVWRTVAFAVWMERWSNITAA